MSKHDCQSDIRGTENILNHINPLKPQHYTDHSMPIDNKLEWFVLHMKRRLNPNYLNFVFVSSSNL